MDGFFLRPASGIQIRDDIFARIDPANGCRILLSKVFGESVGPHFVLVKKDEESAWSQIAGVEPIPFDNFGASLVRKLGELRVKALRHRIEHMEVRSLERIEWPNRTGRPDVLFGRQLELDRLDDSWRKREHRVCALVGQGGEGKSAVASYWAEWVMADEHRPEHVLGWTFRRDAEGRSASEVQSSEPGT